MHNKIRHLVYAAVIAALYAVLTHLQNFLLPGSATFRGYPWLGMLMPALTNAILVGWELTVYIGGGFFLNALYVALGELIVLLVLGSLLFHAIKARHLDTKLFA